VSDLGRVGSKTCSDRAGDKKFDPCRTWTAHGENSGLQEFKELHETSRLKSLLFVTNF
jgi:hypothetical protein